MKQKKVVYFILAASFLFGCATLFKSTPYQLKNDIVFKTTDTQSLTADFFIPKKEALHPAVIVIHGGSWTKKTGDMEDLCEDLAGEGFVAINISYRFAPQNLFPKALEDVRDAVNWVQQNASTYNIDPNRIAVWGYSAGAHLGLLASVDGKLGIKAVVAGGTPANLTAWPNSPLVKTFLGVSYAENQKLWEEASPVFHVTESSPPVFMYHGDWDDLVEPEQMEMMAEALQKKNREVKTYRASYLGHIGVYLLSSSSIQQGIAFLKEKLAI